MTITVWVLRVVFTCASLAWMALIFHASSSTPQEINQNVGGLRLLGPFGDIIGHLVLYGVLAALLLISIWSWRRSTERSVKLALVAAAIAIAYGITDEYLQSMVPDRTATLLDILVNSTGALSAATGLTWFVNVIQRRRYLRSEPTQ